MRGPQNDKDPPPPPPPPWRPARNTDKPLIERILRADLAGSIYALVNLRDHGLGGLAPRGMRYWIAPDKRRICGLTNSGTLMPQAPEATEPDWAGLLAALDGITITALMAPQKQAAAALKGLGLEKAALTHSATMRGLSLTLGRFTMPDVTPLELRPAHFTDRPFMTKWRASYLMEVQRIAPGKARAAAEADIDTFLADGHFRILMLGKNPVAMTGFTAVMRPVVQIGSVFVPPNLRGRGLGRAAIGLQLQEAQEAGAQLALIYAYSEKSAKGFGALGFRPTQVLTLNTLAKPQALTAPPPPPDPEKPAPKKKDFW